MGALTVIGGLVRRPRTGTRSAGFSPGFSETEGEPGGGEGRENAKDAQSADRTAARYPKAPE